jgi:fucose 4-O-acetylase-like acetyltransferase
LVVYAHALRGHVTSGAYDPAWHADVQDDVIYAFHMPMFFFLAGLFAAKSLVKGTGPFLRDKGVTLLWPYVLWSVVSIVLGVLGSGAVNGPITYASIAEIWRTPVYQYWFLYVLLICQLILLAVRADWRVVAALTLASAVIGISMTLGMLSFAFNFFVYFGAGVLAAPWLLKWQAGKSLLLAIVIGSVALFAASYSVGNAIPARVLVLTRAFSGSIGVMALAMLVAPHARWLAVLGAASMSVYVLHTIFSAGLRIAWRMTGIENNLMALVLGTLVGILVPLAIWFVARRYALLPWLGLGSQPQVRA